MSMRMTMNMDMDIGMGMGMGMGMGKDMCRYLERWPPHLGAIDLLETAHHAHRVAHKLAR